MTQLFGYELALTNQSSNTRTVLNGVPLVLRTSYNYSAECWSLDILEGETVLAAGIMLVPYVDLLLPYPVVREKIGVFFVDEVQDGQYKIKENLGSTVRLMWLPLPGMTV